MATDIARRQFLHGNPRRARAPIRPPWALAEEAFVTSCNRCGDCVDACPERVIRCGSGGFPEMDFAITGCSLCGDCVRACRGKALRSLRRAPGDGKPWGSVAHIAGSCLAHRGVICRSCGEACDQGAIRFRLCIGGAATPELGSAACTGCGYCVNPCPVGAVTISRAPSRRAIEDQLFRHAI